MAVEEDFFPLYSRSEADIRTAMNAWANEGLAGGDPSWTDTRPGSWFYTLTQPFVIEMARLWDALGTEVPAASMLLTTWGDNLDNLAAQYGLERKAATRATGQVTFVLSGTASADVLLGVGTEVTTIQTDPDTDAVAFRTTAAVTLPVGGNVTVAIEADETGADGNVSAGAIILPGGSIPGLTSITNAAATAGGSDTEDDEALRERVIAELAFGKGQGNIGDYVRWSLSEPTVGQVVVEPAWNGALTVRVTITMRDGSPVAAGTVTSLQNRLDPITGQGRGIAPIGHQVTVQTVTTQMVTVAANVAPDIGYTEAGLAAALNAAVAEYVNNLRPGEDVIYEHVKACFFRVTGVLDVSGVTLNGGTANVAIAADKIARLTQPITVT